MLKDFSITEWDKEYRLASQSSLKSVREMALLYNRAFNVLKDNDIVNNDDFLSVGGYKKRRIKKRNSTRRKANRRKSMKRNNIKRKNTKRKNTKRKDTKRKNTKRKDTKRKNTKRKNTKKRRR